jgi:hypothetical protein
MLQDIANATRGPDCYRVAGIELRVFEVEL